MDELKITPDIAKQMIDELKTTQEYLIQLYQSMDNGTLDKHYTLSCLRNRMAAQLTIIKKVTNNP